MSVHRLVKVIGPLLVLLLCVLVAYQISQSKPPASKGRFKHASPLLVEVREVVAEKFQVKVESYGVLKANTRTDLLPLVTGEIIKVNPVYQRGAFVKAGQTLLEIDPLEYEVALQVAKGDLASAELALAEEEARSEQALRDWQTQSKKADSEVSDFALRYPQLKAARAKLETAKAQLMLAEKNLERTKVRAPYDGRLIDTFVNIGSVVSTATRLAELYSNESLELSLPIANRDLEFLALPSIQRLQSNISPPSVLIENALVVPSEYWQAKITGTEALVDAENQQIYALAKIEAPLINDSIIDASKIMDKRNGQSLQALKVGQYLHATIDGKSIEDAVLIPNEAIYQGAYVYVVETRNDVDVLVRREIDVRWRNEELSLLKSGLKLGELLVTTPLGQVTSGTRVRINAENSKQEKRS